VGRQTVARPDHADLGEEKDVVFGREGEELLANEAIVGDGVAGLEGAKAPSTSRGVKTWADPRSAARRWRERRATGKADGRVASTAMRWPEAMAAAWRASSMPTRGRSTIRRSRGSR
jgi:hypothetical protein